MPLNALLVWSRCGLGIECSIGDAFLSADGSGACCGADASKASTRANRALCTAASTRNECPTNHFSRLSSLRHRSSAMTESRRPRLASYLRIEERGLAAGQRCLAAVPLRRRIPTSGNMRALRRGELRNAYPHTGAVFAKPGQDHRKLFDLTRPGQYGFFCPITTPDGTPPTTSWASWGCLRSLLRSHIQRRAHYENPLERRVSPASRGAALLDDPPLMNA
jgi:hypothetical protein